MYLQLRPHNHAATLGRLLLITVLKRHQHLLQRPRQCRICLISWMMEHLHKRHHQSPALLLETICLVSVKQTLHRRYLLLWLSLRIHLHPLRFLLQLHPIHLAALLVHLIVCLLLVLLPLRMFSVTLTLRRLHQFRQKQQWIQILF